MAGGVHGLYHLGDRRLLRVAGPDAFAFLQGIVTNDLSACAGGGLVYACLLTPQGQVFADFFVWQDGDAGFVLDVAAERFAPLSQRLSMYRLRAGVDFAPVEGLCVLSAPLGIGGGFKDPRLPDAGVRIYAPALPEDAVPHDAGYTGFAVDLGLPESGAIVYGRDFPSYANLDLLNALSWTKGCFIGQEVAARTHHRGLTKRRLAHIRGAGLAVGDSIVGESGAEIAVVRAVVPDGGRGLALAKLDAVADGQEVFLNSITKSKIYINLPAYVSEHIE